jgi:hypothetical protein
VVQHQLPHFYQLYSFYGQPPRIHLAYLPGEATAAAVDRSLRAGEAVIQLLQFHLLRAQNRMSQ